jgi:ComEC/Rec2-related protein
LSKKEKKLFRTIKNFSILVNTIELYRRMKSKTIQSDKNQTIEIRSSEYPMVRFLVVLVVGMISAILCKDFSLDIFTMVNLFFYVAASIYIVFDFQGLYYKLIFIIGFYLMIGAYHPIPHTIEGKILPAYFKGVLTKIEKKTANSLRCMVKGDVILFDENSNASTSKYEIRLLATIVGDSIPTFLKVGANLESIIQLRIPKKDIIPTEINQKQMLLAKNIDAFATISAQNVGTFDDSLWTLETTMQVWRDELESQMKKWITPKYIPIVLGMMYGNTSGIEDKDLTLLQSYGLIHILSTSGTHVIFITIVFWSFLVLIRSHLLKTILMGILLLCFVLFTGVHISALRAAIMSFCLFILPHFSRSSRPVNLFAFSTVVILLFNPLVLFSYSFYFSTSAILGIYLCHNSLQEHFLNFFALIQSEFYFKRYLKTLLIPTVSLSISASLFSNIIGSFVYYKFSISSLIGNTLFLFLYTMALFSSILTFIFSYCSEIFAYFCGMATSFFLDTAEVGMVMIQNIIIKEISGYSVWMVAVFLCIAIIYCSFSQHIRTFTYRFVISALCFPFVVGISNAFSYKVPDQTLYKFQDSSLLHLHQDDTTATFILIAKPNSLKNNIKSINRFLPLLNKNVTLIIPEEHLKLQKDILLKDTIFKKMLYESTIFKLDSVDKEKQVILYKEYLRTKKPLQLENKEEVHL